MALSIKEKNRLISKYGTWALITGASSGIGKELSMQLANCGFNLILSARNMHLLESLKNEITGSFAVEVEIVIADLEIDSEVEKLIQFCDKKTLGLLVCNAGFATSGEFIATSIEDEIALLQVNCKALMRLSHHFAVEFTKQRKGGILLLSSIVAFQGAPYMAHYAASKAYVQSLGEGLYHELKPKGVDVLCVAPGPVDTGFAKRAKMTMTGAMNPSEVVPPILKALGRKMTVFPGFLSKLMAFGLMLTPRFLKIKVLQMVASRMVN